MAKNKTTPPDILTPAQYQALMRKGFKVHTRVNHALNEYGNFDIIETVGSDTQPAQILAVVNHANIEDKDVIEQITPILEKARQSVATRRAPQ